MNEIEKILKDNMEDYESVKRQALKFIHENKKELSKNYAYAEVCGNPVDASHFFFLIDEKKPGSDLLLGNAGLFVKNYVSSEKGECYGLHKGRFSSGEKNRCGLCKRGKSWISGEYWLPPGRLHCRQCGAARLPL